MVHTSGNSFPRRLSRAIISSEWLYLALLLPLVLTISPVTVSILLFIPLLWIVRRLAYGHFMPSTALNPALLLLLVMVLVSLFATVNITLSLPPVAGTVYGVAVFFAVVSFAGRSARRFTWSLLFYIALGLALAAVALFTTDWQAKFPLVSSLVSYLPGSLNAINPNYLAGVLLWLTPVPLTLAGALPGRMGPLRRKVGTPAAAVIFLITLAIALVLLALLILTQSRSGLLGLAAALTLIAFGLLRRHRRLLLLLLTLAVVILVVLLIMIPSTFWIQLAGISDSASIGEPGTFGLAERFELWQRALYGIEDFAFTGMGMGTFQRVVYILYPLYIMGSDAAFNHAHNHLLQTAVDLGIPGLVAYLAIWLGATAMLTTIWRNAQNAWHQVLALAFGAGMLGYFVYGVTEAIALGGRPGFIFWYLLGLVAALHHLATPPLPSQNLTQ